MMYHLNGLYMIDLTLRLLDVRSFYLVHDIEIGASMGYGFSVTSLCLALILLVVIINETPYNAPIAPVVSDTGRVMSGEQWASIYSKFMFSWVDAMMKKGWVQTLNDEDLLDLPQENQTHYTLAHYRLNYKWNMGLSIMRTFRVPLLIQSGYSMVWSLAMFGPPFFLNKIIKFIENTQPDHQVSVFTAFLYVLGLFLTSCAQSLAYQQALYIGRTLGIRIQSIVIGEVFSKSLRRRDNTGAASNGNNLSEDGKPKGNVNNLLSVDAQKLGEVASYLFYFYCFPIQVTVCIWGLYKLLGVASLYGVLVMVISQPVTFYMGRLFQQSHQKVMGCTDKRLKLMNELLNSIRIVKFFAWEKEFRHRISAARDVELKAIRSRLYSYMWMGNILFLIPVLIMVTVFYFYTKTFALTASTAFTALALFNTFKSIFDELPAITSFILQGSVSLRRIGNFLEEEEIIESPATLHPTVNIGFVDNASFSWENPNNNDNQQSVTPTLSNLNLSFPLNKLSLICGATGSGKSALIASLLGETHRLSGAVILPRKPRSRHIIGGAASGIAYVAQTAWLQNMSIRDNILFGLPYDAERYNKVLYMTALTRDLDILEYGDSTEVGEKGISLSGGQKQRVAIARAVYSQADIVILDDCLSAVDAHTAKHLYEHCLTGEYMKHRTVILVTHHVGLCIRAASYVVALKDGRVESSGTPVEVINSGALGEEFNLLEDIETGNEAESAEGPIPTVQVNLTNTANQKDGHGKLTKDEERAEGGVKFSVYQAYMKASGGYLFWVLILFLFCLAQGSVVGQDYWIRVWSAAYGDMSTQSVGDHPLLKPSHINVNYYLFIYFLIGMLALLVTTLRSLVLFTGSLRASRHIHSQLLERILNAKVRFFDTTPLGRIVNRFSSDLETLDQAVAPSLTFLLYSIIATAYVVILITIITPSFIIPGVFVAFLFWRIGNYYLRSSRDMKRLNSVSRSPIYVQFNESISGVATIRAFGSESRFIEDNCKKVDNNNRPFIWMWATNRWLHCRVDVLGAFVGFCTGCVLIISRSWVDPGLAGLSLSYALTFTHHILWIVRCYAINEMNCVSIERIQHYLEIEQEASSSALVLQETPRPSWPEAGHVKIENLVMQYSPETPVVLHDLSFETKPREKIGIVGRSGSGKSTLALSVFRIMEATSGRIMIDGVDISTLDLNDLRSRLTIIPQDPTLFSGTLRSNLDPFNQHDDAELWAAIKRSHLADESGDQSSNGNDDVVSLDAVVLENGSNWSQGQRQLIALARALVKKSSLIVLDEATSSVDFETDHKIQQTIRTEFGESTLLCIAHRLRTVLDMDRILVLDAGKLVEFDDPYTLITRENGAFKSMCEKSGEYFELLAMAKAQHDKNLE
ncbi:P-loop containing nucleoside triphosphate hydrolase protein [Chlamydoabsidia padenii]|nr:P-loop containing nucleoside triphosphate hydrolase protein [Chlamydoabsidia padenii]